MASRRHLGEIDSLQPVDEPRWLVLRDRCNRALEYRELWPRSDLRAAMNIERERMCASGWQLEPIPRNCSFCFATRGHERVSIVIECFEPGTAGLGHG